MSKLKVNELDTKTGTAITVTTGKTVSVPAGATLDVQGSATLTNATLALPATLPATALTNATNIPAAQLTGQVPSANLGNVDTSGLEDDIALLSFKVAANGSLAKYNLVDQTVDAFEDASGIDASASTNETRNAAANYYSGVLAIDAYTSLYIEDGANNATTFTDASASPYTLTPSGNIKWTNADAKFGTTSILTDNTGDYLTVVSPGANLDFGTGDFTVDLWIKPTGTHQTWDGILELGAHNIGSAGYGIWWNADGMIRTHFGAITVDSANGVIATGAWQHIASVRDGTSYNLYVDGVSVASATNSTSLAVSGHGVKLLTTVHQTDRSWEGYTDSFRISKGIARWTSGFTPPTQAPDSGGIDMTLVSNATTATSAPTKGDIVMTYTNGSGTAVLNTDLTAEFSADNGSTWTSMTLASQGSTGTHFIVSAHDVTRTSTSGTEMKYRIKTLNQSATKETRIHGVSLGWS